MSFVCQDDVLQLFEGMIRAIFKSGLVGEFFVGFARLQITEITHPKGGLTTLGMTTRLHLYFLSPEKEWSQSCKHHFSRVKLMLVVEG